MNENIINIAKAIKELSNNLGKIAFEIKELNETLKKGSENEKKSS